MCRILLSNAYHLICPSVLFLVIFCPHQTEWGHEFRPKYQQLGLFKEQVAKWVDMKLPPVPVMALTATATELVRADIMADLKLDQTAKVGHTGTESQHMSAVASSGGRLHN